MKETRIFSNFVILFLMIGLILWSIVPGEGINHPVVALVAVFTLIMVAVGISED